MTNSLAVETQFLDLPGGRLAYDLTGPDDAALVLCVAGMGDRRAAFRFLTPKLVEAGYRVVCLDQRGHGQSERTLGRLQQPGHRCRTCSR